MTSTAREDEFCALLAAQGVIIPKGSVKEILDQHAAEARAEQREQLARWMMGCDSSEMTIEELESYVIAACLNAVGGKIGS